MTTLTIEKAKKINKSTFSNFDELFRYLLKNKLVSYTEMGSLSYDDMSDDAKKLYDESEKLDKASFINVTNL